MTKLSLEEFWEELEGHDWFYAWADTPEEFEKHLDVTKHLAHASLLSYRHAQLYTTFYRCMYANLRIDEDRNVESIDPPNHEIPEA